MIVRIWGARGSLPSPGADMVRYGGNTSCIQVTLSDGTELVLDAGTGIRHVPPDLGGGAHIHLLITHLHLDHIQGLMFFAPLFQPDAEVTIWGPSSPGRSLQSRIGRYISAPLTPVQVRELPCHLDFRNCPVTTWNIGSARIRAEAVTHRGPTLGYRVTDAGASVCYIPDHEPALGVSLADLEDEWISGLALACDADLLIHDAQYTDAEYPDHLGWGHSSLSHALQFARRARARQLLAFHHDPLHSDDVLDQIAVDAARGWSELGGSPGGVSLAAESSELVVAATEGSVP